MSVLPIVAIVLVLHLTVAPLDPTALYAFLIGSLLVVAGLTIFLFGIDQGLEPIGNFAGFDFMAIAFDASGATTGAITVPFMLSLAYGISAMKKDSKVGEADSFGVIGISSTGAILGVLVVGLLFGQNPLQGTLPQSMAENMPLHEVYLSRLGVLAQESALSLLPILVTYLVLQISLLRHKKNK